MEDTTGGVGTIGGVSKTCKRSENLLDPWTPPGEVLGYTVYL